MPILRVAKCIAQKAAANESERGTEDDGSALNGLIYVRFSQFGSATWLADSHNGPKGGCMHDGNLGLTLAVAPEPHCVTSFSVSPVN